jgi:hypothetical protein
MPGPLVPGMTAFRPETGRSGKVTRLILTSMGLLTERPWCLSRF